MYWQWQENSFCQIDEKNYWGHETNVGIVRLFESNRTWETRTKALTVSIKSWSGWVYRELITQNQSSCSQENTSLWRCRLFTIYVNEIVKNNFTYLCVFLLCSSIHSNFSINLKHAKESLDINPAFGASAQNGKIIVVSNGVQSEILLRVNFKPVTSLLSSTVSRCDLWICNGSSLISRHEI